MDRREAAIIIRSIAESIQREPSQFHISVTVSGQSVVSQGGTGLGIVATGGGPGSTTVGQSVTFEGAQVTISQDQGAHVAIDQVSALLQAIRAIADQLESGTPDTNLVHRIYDGLMGTWVPGVITSVIGNLLTMAAVHRAQHRLAADAHSRARRH